MSDPIQDAIDVGSRLDAILHAITRPRLRFASVCALVALVFALVSLWTANNALQMAILAEEGERASVQALGLRDERIERLEAKGKDQDDFNKTVIQLLEKLSKEK